MVEHISVLLEEAIEYLNIKPYGTYVDATLGGGGHSSAILKQLTTGHLYAFDQDEFAIKKAKNKLSEINDNFTIIHSNFEFIQEELNKRGVRHIDGVLYDLGVSSFHFDIPERGFSYRFDASLDMRMDNKKGITAKDVVNTYSFKDLWAILSRYGEEKYSKLIARGIEREREKKPIETTFDLVDVIKSSIPKKALYTKGHPAKQTFQALRIEVNDELRVLEQSLYKVCDMMKVDGRVVVISFHSLEDRMVKGVFRDKSQLQIPKHLPVMPDKNPEFTLLHKKVIRASQEELENNNRAHSAKLRAMKKNKKI